MRDDDPSRPQLDRAVADLRAALRTGEPLIFGDELPSLDPGANGIGKANAIDAQALRSAVVASALDAPMDCRMLVLGGAIVVGDLDFAGAQLPCPVVFINCLFTGYFDMHQAAIPYLAFQGSHITGVEMDTGASILGDRAHIAGNFAFSNGSLTRGAIRLAGGRVDGQLILRGASLGSDGQHSLFAQALQIGDSAFLDEGFTAIGKVLLSRSRIADYLSFNGAHLNSTMLDTYALEADGLNVGGEVTFNKGFRANGTVRLSRCRLGDLSLSGAQLLDPSEGEYSLDCRGTEVNGGLTAGGGFHAQGSLSFVDTVIQGDLDLGNSTLSDTNGEAHIMASRAKIGGSLLLDHGFRCSGAFALPYVSIGGDVNMSGARVFGHLDDGVGILASAMQVAGDFLAGDGFETTGALDISRTCVAGRLILRGARVTGTSTAEGAPLGCSVLGDSLEVGAGAYFDLGFQCTGSIRLLGGRIQGQLSFSGARVNGTDSDGSSLIMDRLQVEGSLFMQENTILAGAARLPNARINGQCNALGLRIERPDRDGDCLVAHGLEVSSGLRMVLILSTTGSVDLTESRIEQAFMFALRCPLPAGVADLSSVTGSGNTEETSSDEPFGITVAFTAGGVGKAEDQLVPALRCQGLRADGDVDLQFAYDVPEHIAIIIGHPPPALLDLTRVKLAGAMEARGVHSVMILDGADIQTFKFSSRSDYPVLRSAVDFRIRDFGEPSAPKRKDVARWLDRGNAAGQTWQEVAAAYERRGMFDDGRWLRYQAAARAGRQSSIVHRLFGWLYQITTGYGYYPMRTLGWLAIITTLTVIACYSAGERFTSVSTGDVQQSDQAQEPSVCPTRGGSACFDPISYGIGSTLPFVTQDTTMWRPPAGGITYLLMLLRVVAWILAALFLAGITGLLRRRL